MAKEISEKNKPKKTKTAAPKPIKVPKVKNLSKVGLILKERDISQAAFIDLILKKTGISFGKSRVSQYVNSKKSFMSTETAKILARTLDVSLDDVVDGWKPKIKAPAPVAKVEK